MLLGSPYIPEYITVHLGAMNAEAPNVTVPFPDYIKNVASSEVYPTWEPSALRANILCQISYALNRLYVEFYRSRGYPFDITSTTAMDQKFIYGRNIFENIDTLVDALFDSYIRRPGFVEPLAAKYCNGTTTTCDGLSQWGSQDLAKQGKNSLEILRYYYGDNIELVHDAPVKGAEESYPGYPLSVGSSGDAVTFLQNALNRVGRNYPAIPKISPVDGVFGADTQRALKKFQTIFDLTPDGVAGKATWYRLVNLYAGVKQLSELNSEGQLLLGMSLEYPDAVRPGDRGEKVTVLQYLLAVIGEFYPTVPPVEVTGVFGEETERAVRAVQNIFSLPHEADKTTWETAYDAFLGIGQTLEQEDGFLPADYAAPYGGTVLGPGSSGPDVRTLQEYLGAVSLRYPAVRPVPVTGIYGGATRSSVLQYQTRFGLPRTGRVNEADWNHIADTWLSVWAERQTGPGQYPGTPLKNGDRDPSDPEVRP